MRSSSAPAMQASFPPESSAPDLQGTLSSRLFESFADLPAEWSGICGDDLGMDARLLEVFQKTLSGQCRCWGVMVYGADGQAIACAALCLFATEVIESNQAVIAGVRDGLRRVWPGFARMKVLFCGLPVPSGSTHLRMRPGADVAGVTEELGRVMRGLARAHGARLLVFKELGEQDGTLKETLGAQGYIQGDIPPMHHIQGAFKNFADYRDRLKSRYRAQVQRSQKKLAGAGFEALTGRGAAFFAEHWSEHAHALYVDVQKRAAQKLELLPASFFSETARALDKEVALTVIRREGRLAAFTFAITRGKTHYNCYSGLDYALNVEGDLYFNLFYHDLDQAFRAGATCVHLGQTSDSFKARLGSRTEALHFFALAPSVLFHKGLRAFAPLAFPKVARIEAHDVFAGHSE